MRANERQDDICAGQGLPDLCGEIHPGPQRVDVHENAFVADCRNKGVMQSSCITAGVLPTITDEDRGHSVWWQSTGCHSLESIRNVASAASGCGSAVVERFRMSPSLPAY